MRYVALIVLALAAYRGTADKPAPSAKPSSARQNER